MKAFAFSLFAASALCACTQDASPESQAEAEAANNVVETAAGGNQALPPAPGAPGGADGGDAGEDGGGAAAPPPRDPPARGGPDRPGRPPTGPVPPDGAESGCGAARYQWLVGRPRSAIPRRPPRARWRVTCTGCPVTMDYSPQRLNIFYDAETERVEEVRCG